MAECCRSEAFVSLATNDFYAKGALALGKSIRDSGSGRQLALVITSGVSQHMKEALSSIWDELVLVEEMDSGDAERLAVLNRPELGVTFTKLAVWTLVRYSKCVYLDADTLVLANVDELFQRDELSAAPDIGWPDCFNSGVFVFRPSMETFRSLVELARQTGSFDGGDQGLLNQFWEDWATSDISFHLPFIYNMTANPSYGYAPAFLKYKEKVKIVHFIGSVKPWQHRYLSDLDTVILLPGTYSSQNVNQDFIHRWWQVYSSLPLSGTSHHFPVHASRTPSTPGHFSPAVSNWLGSLGSSAGGGPAHAQYSSSHDDKHSNAMMTWGSSSSSTQLASWSRTSNSTLDSYRHSITPMDSISQFGSHFSPSTHQQQLASSDADHQASTFLTTSSSSSLPDQAGPISSSSSHCPTSFLSHEDIHSHISLSFYTTDIYNHVVSLASEEPRTYYAEDLRSEVDDEDEDDQYQRHPFLYAQPLNSSSHISLPSFNTPSSSGIFKQFPPLQQEDFHSEGHRFSQLPDSLLNQPSSQHSGSSSTSLSLFPPTEYDVETPVPCPSNDGTALPTFPLASPPTLFGIGAADEETVGEEEVWSDSVTPLPFTGCSISPSHTPPLSSPPLPPSLPPSTLYPFKAIDTRTTMDAAAIGEKFSQPEEGKYSHRREFEAGIVDYYGKDSFNNIFTFMKEQMGDMGGDLEVRGDGGSVDNVSLKSKSSSTWSKEEEGLDAEQGKSQTSGDGKFSRPMQSVASGTQSAGGSSGSSLLDRDAKPPVSSESEPTTTQSSTDKAPVEESSPAEIDKCPVASRELSRKEPQADESTEVETSPSPKKSQPLPEVQEESSATADKNRMTEKMAPSTSSSKSSEKQAAVKTTSIELFSKPK